MTTFITEYDSFTIGDITAFPVNQSGYELILSTSFTTPDTSLNISIPYNFIDTFSIDVSCIKNDLYPIYELNDTFNYSSII